MKLVSLRAAGGEEAWHSPNHYRVLSVPVDFSERELTKAYRKASRANHPDKATGSNEAFQRVAEAHQTLADPDTRRAFDAGEDLDKLKRDEEDDDDVRTHWEETERKYYPERYPFLPFGDPFEGKRRHDNEKERKQRLAREAAEREERERERTQQYLADFDQRAEHDEL